MRLSFVFWAVILFFSKVFAAPSFGVFMVVKGDIKVESTKKSGTVKVSDRIYPGDTVVSGTDSRAKIVMNDRNIIFVSPQTRMTIAAYNEGADKNVELDLQQGKVLNNVQQKYDGDKNKFIIKTPTAVAGVRGTSFITSYDSATRVTNVFTQTGVVTLTNLVNMSGKVSAVEIKRGETSSAGVNGVPETPKVLPPDQMKRIESDVTGNAPPPALPGAGKGDAKADGKNDGKNNGDASGTVAAPSPGKGDGFRLGDKKDTSVDGVDKVPGALPGIAIPPAAGPVFNRPPSRTLINDTVQNKDRAKVIITPVRPPTNK